MLRRVIVLTAFLMAAVVPLPMSAKDSAPDQRMPIFVIAAGTKDRRFTDPDEGRQDSARDLLNRMRSSKVWRPVELEDQAIVTIEIAKRESRADGDERVVFVRLIAGDYTSDIEAVGDESWGDAASQLAKQLDRWGVDNAVRLAALPKPATNAPSR